jgi:hypothetical protein
MHYKLLYINWRPFQTWSKTFKEQNENNSFKGIDPLRSKIVINNNTTEQYTLSVTKVAQFHTRIKKIFLLNYQNFSDSGIYYGTFKTLLSPKTR